MSNTEHNMANTEHDAEILSVEIETCETVDHPCDGDCSACNWDGWRPWDAPEPEECV